MSYYYFTEEGLEYKGSSDSRIISKKDIGKGCLTINCNGECRGAFKGFYCINSLMKDGIIKEIKVLNGNNKVTNL